MKKEEEKFLLVKCVENYWDGVSFYEEDQEYRLSLDYPLPRKTFRKTKNGRVIESHEKFVPLNALARKAFEMLDKDEEISKESVEAQSDLSPAAQALKEVNTIIRDNGLDEDEIKDLFKKEKAKKAEDKLKVLTKYMES